MNAAAVVTDLAYPGADHDSTLHVFVSHKLKDRKLAKIIESKLGFLGGAKLEIFLSEKIEFGNDWDDEVHAALERSDWLFLLYTDPTAEWDWCLYETGYFSAGIKAGKHAPICLHSPDVVPPKPVKRWKTVPADAENVVTLLNQLYGEPPRKGVPPIRPDLLDRYRDHLINTAEDIVAAFGAKPQQFWWPKFFRITLEGDQIEALRRDGHIAEDAAITSDIASLQLFNLHTDRCAWSDITSELTAESGHWLDALAHTLRHAVQKKEPNFSIPRFYAPGNRQLYRPVVYRLDCNSNDTVCFKILLVKVTDTRRAPHVGDFWNVSELLRMAQDFRWDVIDEFTGEVRRLMLTSAADPAVLSDCLYRLKTSVERVELDAMQRGYQVKENVKNFFESEEDRNTVDAINDRWRGVREKIMTAVVDNDLENAGAGLEDMRQLNKEFMRVCAKRHFEMLSRMD